MNVPGTQDCGTAVADGDVVAVVVGKVLDGEVMGVEVVVRNVVGAVVVCPLVVRVVLVMTAVVAELGVVREVVLDVRSASSSNVLVRLPVIVKMGPLVPVELAPVPVPVRPAAVVVEFKKGNGGVDVVLERVVYPVVVAPVVPADVNEVVPVVAIETVVVLDDDPVMTKPGPGSGVISFWP